MVLLFTLRVCDAWAIMPIRAARSHCVHTIKNRQYTVWSYLPSPASPFQTGLSFTECSQGLCWIYDFMIFLHMIQSHPSLSFVRLNYNSPEGQNVYKTKIAVMGEMHSNLLQMLQIPTHIYDNVT